MSDSDELVAKKSWKKKKDFNDSDRRSDSDDDDDDDRTFSRKNKADNNSPFLSYGHVWEFLINNVKSFDSCINIYSEIISTNNKGFINSTKNSQGAKKITKLYKDIHKLCKILEIEIESPKNTSKKATTRKTPMDFPGSR